MYSDWKFSEQKEKQKAWHRCKKCGVVINSKYQYCLKYAKTKGFVANNHD